MKGEHFNRASDLFHQGKYDEAIAEWEKVLEIDPGHELSKQKIERAKSARKELEKLPEQPLREQ